MTLDQHTQSILQGLVNGKTIEQCSGRGAAQEWAPVNQILAFKILGNGDAFNLRVRPSYRIVNGMKLKSSLAEAGDFSNSSIQILLKSGHDVTDGFHELHFLTREDAIAGFDKLVEMYK